MKRKQYRPGRGMTTSGTMLMTDSCGRVVPGIWCCVVDRAAVRTMIQLSGWRGGGYLWRWLESRRVTTPRQMRRSPNFSKMTSAERQILERAK